MCSQAGGDVQDLKIIARLHVYNPIQGDILFPSFLESWGDSSFKNCALPVLSHVAMAGKAGEGPACPFQLTHHPLFDPFPLKEDQP